MSDLARPVDRIEATIRLVKRWTPRVVLAFVAVVALWTLYKTVVRVATQHLWFASLGLSGVYSTVVRSQVLLFVLFALLAGAIAGGSLVAIRRGGPYRQPDPERQELRWRFRRGEPRLWPWLLALAVLIPAVQVGSAAAGQWQTYLLWRHAEPWHATDPQFHRDLSYFIEVYPFHRLVVNLFLQSVKYAVWVTLIASYLYGALRIRGKGPWITKPLKAQLSLLGGLYLLGKAGALWLDRFALATSQNGTVTGPSYTDVHALLPGKIVLILVALAAAGLLFANVALKRLRWLAAGVAAMLVATAVVGAAWPSLVHRFREQPSASTVSLPAIARDQKATLAAFALDGQVTSVPATKGHTLTGAELRRQTTATAQYRILDPNRLAPTFNVKQELEAYYSFKSTLDVGHYPLEGKGQDVALAVRELNVRGIPQKSWTASHLVYTHGYGLVAAPTDQMDPKAGTPLFLDGGNPPEQQIPVTQPQIYFGEKSPAYSIVGQPKGGSKQLEFDHPGVDGARAAHTTYTGGGGIPIGSLLRRALFAQQLGSPNILFSSEINSGSQLLMVRNPRARVAAVAPWLTTDGTTYPAVVDGHIVFVVDAYTSSSNYPSSQLVNLASATRSTLTTQGSSTTLPNRSANYLRNSVKATVDAYSGKVTLYEWDQDQHPDPLLRVWESAFPGLVQDQSSIPEALLPHLRYPQGLFDVQRTLLAKYHVTDASDFYSGNDFWRVPTDPTVAATNRLNTSRSRGGSTPSQPSTYMSLSPDGFGTQTYSLSSPLVTLNRRELAAFVSVDSEPGPDYGKFTVLRFPSGSSVESPAQVQNDIESSTKISEALTLQRGGNSKVVLGNLLAVPLGGRIMYVEPVYTQAAGGSSFPILRHVIAVYGSGEPAFEDSLLPALRDAVRLGDTG